MVAVMAKGMIPLVIGLVVANLLVVSTFGKLECEDLPVEDCAFSVASSGTRCVLEKYRGKDDSIRYECQSSIIMAEKQEEWIESDECVKACGLERMSVGLSTDLLMDSHFTEMLCSSECLNNCPNLIDLYISLAAGEGMYLPQLCKTHRSTYRRSIADPVKKAMDAEYEKRFLPRLTSGSDIAPAGSQISETGDNTPLAGGIQRSVPGYNQGYDYRGEIAPTSPVFRAPLQKAPGRSTTKRPFFTASSPTPTSTPTPSPDVETTPVAATPDTVAAPIPPEITPYIYAPPPEMAPAPLPELSAEELYWQKLAEEKMMLDRSQLNDEEYLYEIYFH